MSTKNPPIDFYVGLIAGISGSIMFALIFVAVEMGPTRKAIAECEHNLPRSQHCVVTAVPVTPDK